MSLFTGGIAAALALAGTGAAAAVQAHGANVAADAATHGADLQSKAAQEALDYAKGQKAKQEAAWAPYAAASQNAVGQLAGATRTNPGAYTGQPFGIPQGQPQQGSTLMNMGNMQPPMPMAGGGAGMPPQTPQGGQMVTLQAPDGTSKQMPANQAQFYISRGAKAIG